jgi:hypothetical protein
VPAADPIDNTNRALAAKFRRSADKFERLAAERRAKADALDKRWAEYVAERDAGKQSA